MIEASVGFQCPECVREGNRDVRHATGRFGGEVATTPTLTYLLIGINVLVFLVSNASDTQKQLYADFGLFPPLVALGEYDRLLTSAFLHYNIAHLLFNMWALWAVGQSLELWLGRVRFLALYVLSALGGTTLVYLASPLNSNTVGASGAIFGLFGAVFVVSRRLNLDIRSIAFVIVLNLVFTFALSSVSWQGHLGGLVTGGLLAFAYVYAPREHRNVIQFGVSAAFVALFTVAVLLRTAALT
jgi:membrane associated rhomboid family serine protease